MRAGEMKDKGERVLGTDSPVFTAIVDSVIPHFSQPVKSTIPKRTGVPNVNCGL